MSSIPEGTPPVNGRASALATAQGVLLTEQLEMTLHLDGFRRGVPPWVSAATWAIDVRCYSRSGCPRCGQRRHVQAWHRASPRTYKLVLSCPTCLVAEEG